MRMPNKLFLIEIALSWRRLMSVLKKNTMMDTIQFFNPEHIYLFRRSYLMKRLKNAGYSKIRFIPAKGKVGDRRWRWVHDVLFGAAMLVYFISVGRIIATPSQIVFAERQ